MYLVLWDDANYDTEHDGPSADLKSGLVLCPHIGFHVKTGIDHIVLAGEATVDSEGRNNSRFHMTIPRVHVRHMIEVQPVRAPEEGEVSDAPKE